MYGIGDFSLLINFVNQSQKALQDALTPDELKLKPLEIPKDEYERDRDVETRNLDQAIKDAERQKWVPQAQLLTQVRKAVADRPYETAQPDLAAQFQNESLALPQKQQQQLPDAFDSALFFLRQTYQSAKADLVPKDGQPAPTTVPQQPGQQPAVPGQALALPGQVPGQIQVPGFPGQIQIPGQAPAAPVDPRIVDFVQRHFSDNYTPVAATVTPTKSEQTFLKTLTKDDRAAFLQKPAQERTFIVSLNPTVRAAYDQLQPPEQKLFRNLAPGERGQFLKMNPDERETYAQLDPGQRSAFLLLHPDQREKIRLQAQNGRPVLPTIDATLTELAKKEPAEVANTVAADMVDMLGFEPDAGPGVDPSQRAMALAKATTLMANHLAEKPGDINTARLATLKDLLHQPEFQDKLMNELENRLVGTDPKLADHMLMLRPQLIDHAEALLQPNTDREGLLAGLEKAVNLSMQFTEKYPPTRKELRISSKFKHWDGVRGVRV
jgi:hypothetical protein